MSTPNQICSFAIGSRVMDYAQKQNAETGRDFILHNAPVLILVHAPKRARFASDNCNIATTTIINYAHALGLGTCLTGLLTMYLRYSGNLRKNLAFQKIDGFTRAW